MQVSGSQLSLLLAWVFILILLNVRQPSNGGLALTHREVPFVLSVLASHLTLLDTMPSLADMEGLLFHGITTFVTPLPTSAAEPTFQCNWKWLSPNNSNSRPADILVQGWERGLPAAFDVTVTSPLTPASLEEASASVLQPALLKPESTLPMTASVKN